MISRASTQTDPDRSLYTRHRVHVTLEDGVDEEAWVYFYNPVAAPPASPPATTCAIRAR